MNLTGAGRAIFICVGLAQLTCAGTIIESNGNSSASVPLGYYAPYGTATVYAVSWSQSSSYTGVEVFANLFNSGGGGTVDYALVTAIGQGTSFAQDGIIEGSVITPANPADVELFQLPVLGPGAYYLVLNSPTAGSGWQYNFPFQSNFTTAPGVSFLGSQQAQFADIDSNFTPASIFSGIGYPVEFEVTGTQGSAAPEPNFAAGITLVLIGFSAALRKARSRSMASANIDSASMPGD
jgi:hypothetical protein